VKEETLAAIRIAMASGISPRQAKALHGRLGSFASVIGVVPRVIQKVLGCSPAAASALVQEIKEVSPRRMLREAKKHKHVPVCFGEPDYSPLLAGISDPPVVLWAWGDRGLLVRPTIAVVGARRCSVEAPGLVAQLVEECVEYGWTIVSGGARGVDAAAHREAIRHDSPTIVVLGSGMGRPYPPEHRRLFSEVVEHGGLVLSEYPFDRDPRPGQFPARNRIVAGLCIGVVMIEAGPRSGALITGRLAGEDYGREVMAMPGRVLGGGSAGCHRAIREGWAALVDEPVQVLEQVREARGLLKILHEAVKNTMKIKDFIEVADERSRDVMTPGAQGEGKNPRH
jgi:DNA processing protein